MKKLFTTSLLAFLIIAILTTSVAHAQEPKTKKEERNIIIKEAGDDKLKINIDGDNITINGMPYEKYVEQNKNCEIKILNIKDKDAIIDLDMLGVDNERPVKFKRKYKFNSDDFNKPFLGVFTEKTGDEKGIRINEVVEGSPAEEAGLQADDIITKVESSSINTPDELSDFIKGKAIGDKVKIYYSRDGKEQSTTATLAKRETPDLENMDEDVQVGKGKNWFSLTMPNMDEFSNKLNDLPYLLDPSKPKLGMKVEETEDGNGVKVTEVTEGGNAENAGIKVGDLITSINKNKVESISDIRDAMRDGRDTQSYNVDVLRNNKKQNIEIKIAKKLKKADL